MLNVSFAPNVYMVLLTGNNPSKTIQKALKKYWSNEDGETS